MHKGEDVAMGTAIACNQATAACNQGTAEHNVDCSASPGNTNLFAVGVREWASKSWDVTR